MAVLSISRQSTIKNTAATAPAWRVATWATSDSPSPPSMNSCDFILVHVVFGNNVAIQSITHDGNALTKKAHQWFSGLSQREEFWYMKNPSTGIKEIKVTLASSMFNGMSICVMGFNNVNDIGTHSFNGTSNTPHVRNRNVSAGSMIYMSGISTTAHSNFSIDGTSIPTGNFKPNQANVNDILSGAWSPSSHSAGSIATQTATAGPGTITNSYVEILAAGGGGGSRRRVVLCS